MPKMAYNAITYLYPSLCKENIHKSGAKFNLIIPLFKNILFVFTSIKK